MEPIAYVNGAFVPLSEAKVSVLDRGFLFADGIYEVAAVLDGKLIDNASHLARLERVFESLGERAKGKTCYAMKGLIEEGSEVIKEDATDAVRDAALIAAAQRVEHDEIAGYGTVRTFGERLGHTDAARLLQKTLDEERETDKLLTQIAESCVNEFAEMGAGAESER